ncbi:LPS translocon maturation chaperone LptM [Marinobacterium aestuariivivens]
MHWVAMVVAMAALTGCGQKGPLYLPDQAPQTSEQQQHPENDERVE